MSRTLTDIAREVAVVNTLKQIRGWEPERLRQLAWDAYPRWADQASLIIPEGTLGLPHPVVAPFTFSPFDEVRIARRCLIACGCVVLQVADSINYAPRMLRMLVLLEDAIDRGVVRLVPDRKMEDDRYFDKWFSQVKPIGDKPNSEEEMRRLLDPRMAEGEVAAALDICARQPHLLNPACVNSYQVEALRCLLESQDGETVQNLASRSDEIHFLPDLIALDLPSFDLSISDLLAVQDDGLFDDWHRAVATAMERIRTIPSEDLLNPSAGSVRVLREELQTASREVLRMAQKSPVLKAACSGSLRFALVSAAGALGVYGVPAGRQQPQVVPICWRR